MSAPVVSWPRVKRTAPRARESGTSHGGEHVARLERPAGAGRSARRAHPTLAEGHQQLLPLDAGEAEVEVTGQCRHLRGHRAVRAGDRLHQSDGQPVAERADPARRVVPLRGRQPQRRGQPDRPDHVLRAAAALALLATPVVVRDELGRGVDGQRADPDRAPHLVGAQRHEVGSRGGIGQAQVRGRLHRVGEDTGGVAALPHRGGHAGQGLDHTGLVVGQHHRHQRGRRRPAPAARPARPARPLRTGRRAPPAR